MIARVLIAVLLAGVGITGPAAGASAYSPAPGPIFNRPVGTKTEKEYIATHINRTIDSARRGSTIRIATYTIDRVETAQKLIQAHNRGVSVQIVVNQHRRPHAVHMLKNRFGSHLHRRSFIIFCEHGCRGRAAAMHAKFYTFSHSGRSKDVVIVSSANLTVAQANIAWNDSYTIVGRPAIFDAYQRAFAEMARDVPVRNPFRQLTVGRFTNYIFPRPGATRASDPVYQALDKVRCNAATDGAGEDGHTVIKVAMFTILGQRGLYLARKLKTLDDAGCRVYVIYGAPSHNVVQVLKKSGPNGGVVVRDARFDDDLDGVKDRYTHTKYFIISGAIRGDSSAWVVYTGSENWTDLALTRADENMVRITSRYLYSRWAANFTDIARNGSKAVPKRTALRHEPAGFGQFADF